MAKVIAISFIGKFGKYTVKRHDGACLDLDVEQPLFVVYGPCIDRRANVGSLCDSNMTYTQACKYAKVLCGCDS